MAGTPRLGERQSFVRAAADGLRVTRLLAVWMPLIDAELADGPEEWERAVAALSRKCGRSGPPGAVCAAALGPSPRGGPETPDRPCGVVTEAFVRADELGLGLLTARLAPLAAQMGVSVSSAAGSAHSPH